MQRARQIRWAGLAGVVLLALSLLTATAGLAQRLNAWVSTSRRLLSCESLELPAGRVAVFAGLCGARLEEVPQFLVWANKYASKRFTHADFVRNNVPGDDVWHSVLHPGVALPVPDDCFLFFALALNQTLFNIFLHVSTTAAFGVYSSDAITALDFGGVYRLATDGTLTQLTRELRAPN